MRRACITLFILCVNISVEAQSLISTSLKGKSFNNITLELSLKPFKKNDKSYIREVATEIFTQWHSLLRHTDTVSIMLWTSDGSEILDYRGKPGQRLEWAKYMGNPNTGKEIGSLPKEMSLHERAYLYMDNPPEFKYADLKFIVQTLRETGRRMTGKFVRIGATFDPGPEFAISDFKYNRHTEILGGNAMGKRSFVNCYSVLNADSVAYAGFPKGIPAKTPFGIFFGKQSQHFLHDMGFDYIWFSNGFGFGVEGWSSTGAIFDGKSFDAGKLDSTRTLIGNFWKSFRKGCPFYPVETRGTNISAGIDLARDGVDLNNIYLGKFNMLPPPNSPWAAIDGDFGLELTGYMSRMAEIPDSRYTYRYYTHDPWWLNSPWFDRYQGEPHDIYLPMSVARIDSKGQIGLPTHLNFLTIDNTYGNMPAQLPDEVIPHILKGRYDAPTAPGPLVWVYPFDEYFSWAYKYPERLPAIYFGDWYIRQAINNGLPLNTIISTGNFAKLSSVNNRFLKTSVLLTIVPEANSQYEKMLLNFIKSGGQVMVYGPAEHASKEFLELINLAHAAPLEGSFTISLQNNSDRPGKPYPTAIRHQSLFSGGGISSIIANNVDGYTKRMASVEQSGETRPVAWSRAIPEWKGGKVVYLRGTNSSSFTGDKLLKQDDAGTWFPGPVLTRYALKEFGIEYGIDKVLPTDKSPVLTISRTNNAFMFSGYVPNTTVLQRFKFPQGAPLLIGYETELADGFSVYHLPTAWHKEVRMFLSQDSGVVSCREGLADAKGVHRRIHLSGLKNATVRIYPEDGMTLNDVECFVNSAYPWKTGRISARNGEEKYGECLVVENISGVLDVAW